MSQLNKLAIPMSQSNKWMTHMSQHNKLMHQPNKWINQTQINKLITQLMTQNKTQPNKLTT